MIRSQMSHNRNRRPGFRAGSTRSGDERGAVAIIVAVSMFALVAFILLAVQLGTIGTYRALLQGSADEAAMAGASQLDHTSTGLTNAMNQAMNILSGGKNFPSTLNQGSDLDISGDAFETGTWDFADTTFTPSTDPEEVNAVRVRGRKLATNNGPIDMFLGGAFGPDTVDISRTGIAALGSASGLSCPPDIPVAACEQKLQCGKKIRLLQSPTPSDNGSWWSFPDSANANYMKDKVKNCGTVPQVRTGDCILLNSGEIASADIALRTRFNDYMAAHPCGSGNVRLPDTEEPTCLDCGVGLAGDPIDINDDGVVNDEDCGMPVIIPLIPCADDVGNTCTGDSDTLANLNQSRQVSGFVFFVITEVKGPGQDPGKWVDGYPVCGVAIPDTPTGPGPGCSASLPNACATEPILVNARVNELSAAGD